MRSAKAGWVYRTSLLMGEDFLLRQAYDIRHAIECSDTSSSSHIVGLYARGPNASLAAAYALATARPQPEFAVFRNGFLSFQEVWQRRHSTDSSADSTDSETSSSLWGDETPEHWFPLNVLEAGDISAFFSARRGREFIIDPLNGMTQAPSTEDSSPSTFRFISLEDFLMADWD